MENNYTIVDNDLYKDYAYLDKVINKTLEEEQVNGAVFSIIFVTLDEIHKLNKKYRGIDRPTDVISFALEDSEDFEINDLRVLGDIYICIDRMKEQAKEYGHSQMRELSFLTCHGLLHLLGYDHMEPEDEKIMFGKQDKILEELEITRWEVDL